VTKLDIVNFCAAQRLAVLASLSMDGKPQSALVGIAVTADLEIVFDTVQTTRKYRNLIATPACSFVIGWSSEITVQYEGEAKELSVSELPRYKKIYFEKFPDGPSRQQWPGITYFVVRPRWIRYSDFAETPPQIEEFTF
jgi:pyridoxine/pyridoxamine 5'-phosphate oxidase